MRQGAAIAGLALLLGVGAYGVFGGLPSGPLGLSRSPATAAEERGRPTGAFDSRMSGVCQFSCAAPQAFAEQDVALQPGVAEGRLTRCPVSGVVFVVDAARPRVTLATGEYVLCCDGCAGRFRKHRDRFVHL